MTTIHLTTFIAAPVERVFDLSRSIDLHKRSMHKRKEQAVNGVTFGLISEGESVTWKAKHFFAMRVLKVEVTQMKRPVSFTDESVSGDLRNMKHEHHFKIIENGTLMIDIFRYELGGIFGKLINRFYLHKYMQHLLEERNEMIREYAESDKWKFFLQK
ncbi:MAG TPA: SRPBCC family protein [Flavitalea sp.]|nr:SRPBCC family protein [Flavitalea sp.]